MGNVCRCLSEVESVETAAVDTEIVTAGGPVEILPVLGDTLPQRPTFCRMASPDSAHPVYMNVAALQSDLWSLE